MHDGKGSSVMGLGRTGAGLLGRRFVEVLLEVTLISDHCSIFAAMRAQGEAAPQNRLRLRRFYKMRAITLG
jgi:hypothetical protein